MRNKDHVLYTKDDFKDWTTEQIENNGGVAVAVAVVYWGLNVCKNCHEYEGGLDNPCTRDRGKEVQHD